MAQITFITVDGRETVLEASGGTLMEAAVKHGISGIEGDCGGVCSCGTCHVHLAARWMERVGQVSELERDVINFLPSASPCSRLACQIELTEQLDGAVHINVQLADHDTPVEESVRLTVKLMQESEKLGAKCSLEVHRDTCTETPEKTYAIAAGYKKATGRLLPMTWDFSHLSVVKHLTPPYWERLLVDAKLIQHAGQFHFRPFNGHHCQVPVTDGHGNLSVELKQWLPFLDKTLALWLKGNQAGREVFVVPEMGPVRGSYNLAQLPNSWEDAKILRPIIAEAWERALDSK